MGELEPSWFLIIEPEDVSRGVAGPAGRQAFYHNLVADLRAQFPNTRFLMETRGLFIAADSREQANQIAATFDLTVEGPYRYYTRQTTKSSPNC